MAHKHSKQTLYVEINSTLFKGKVQSAAGFVKVKITPINKQCSSWTSRSSGTDIALKQQKISSLTRKSSHKQTFPIRTVWKVVERVRWSRDRKRCEDIQAEDAVRSKGGSTRPRSPGKNKGPLVQQLVCSQLPFKHSGYLQ